MAQITDIIKYDGDNSTFIWKHPCEDFNNHETERHQYFWNRRASDYFLWVNSVFVNKVVIPEWKYQDAVARIGEEKYEEAYGQLTALEGYKDSK